MLQENKLFTLIIVCLSLLFSSQLYSAKRYCVGGTGTWNGSSTANWSASSGGASGASVPTSTDDVFFDASSGLTGATVTTGTDGVCNNFTWSASVGTIAISSNLSVSGDFTWSGAGGTINGGSFRDLNIGGSFSINAAISFTSSFLDINFNSTATGKTITTNGKSIPYSLNFEGTGGGWTMQDALTTTNEFTLTAGTFNTGNFTLAVRQLNCYNFSSTTRQINLGSSTINITPGSTWTSDVLNLDGSNLTVNAGTSTINITLSASATFSYDIGYNGKTLYNLSLSSTSVAIITTGAVTFNNLTIGAGNIYQIASGTTHTILNTLSAVGTCTNYIYLRSSTPGSLATMAFSGGAQTSSNVVVQDVTSTTNTNTCTDCVDLVSTDGTWCFSSPEAARNLYWIGNSGNYSDPTEWSTTSGGANDVTCSPTPIDNVYFDANSFSSAGRTVTINRQYVFCKNMDWSGVTNSPTFSGSFVNLTIS